MSSDDLVFLLDVMDGDLDSAKDALEAGANPNGYEGLPCVPIVMATIANDVRLVNFFLERGADPDMPATQELPHPCPGSDIADAMVGERALHIAARNGNVEVVRLLLKQFRADPNVTDKRGYTPLMATCDSPCVCLEVVQLLLEGGADPALAEERGFIPLHGVALKGHVNLIDMLYSRAPATLNRCAVAGRTPLFMACAEGHESMVSKLLSLGARQPMPLDEEKNNLCPLSTAVYEGFAGVVRVMINEGGIRAVGGGIALSQALYMSIPYRRASILRLLLGVDGEGRRSEWANNSSQSCLPLLHYSAAKCHPAAVSVLLEAGADEAVRDSDGRIPRDVIGVGLDPDDKAEKDKDPYEEVAIRRMLQRGPAYRARSWAWPSVEEADGGSGDGDTAAAAAAAAVLSSPPAVETPPVLGVRIFRQKEKNNRKLFVRLISRYCAKD